VARQSPGRRNTEEHAEDNVAEVEETDDVREADAVDAGEEGEIDDLDLDDEDAGADGEERPLWAETNIEPVEIALPSGTGYTLRAYRFSSTLTPTDIGERDEDDPFARRVRRPILDDDETAILDDESNGDTLAEIGRHRIELDNKDVPYTSDTLSDDELEDELADADEDEEPDELAEEEEEPADEEVPVFLSHLGKLLLFRSTESLVAFVRSGAPNDLAQVDGWAEVAERIEPGDVVPSADDTYELDLVVENLRGGHDVWDLGLLIKAGEVARDIGYALRLQPVLTALSSESPLDDLDDALRGTADGGVGGFFARRRLRKIGAQQATLGWRTIIGKISGAVDWRD
jgi:hypothetical protein